MERRRPRRRVKARPPSFHITGRSQRERLQILAGRSARVTGFPWNGSSFVSVSKGWRRCSCRGGGGWLGCGDDEVGFESVGSGVRASVRGGGFEGGGRYGARAGACGGDRGFDGVRVSGGQAGARLGDVRAGAFQGGLREGDQSRGGRAEHEVVHPGGPLEEGAR